MEELFENATFKSITEIISTGSHLVAILGFVLLYRQFTQVKQTLYSSAINSLYIQNFDVKKFIGTNPEVYPYIYQGKKIYPHNKMYIKVDMVAKMYLSYLENLAVQRNNLPKKSRLAWTENFIKISLEKSPIMKSILEEDIKRGKGKFIYSEALRRMID